jgi:Sap-like sulfolipid-1-addressing protein
MLSSVLLLAIVTAADPLRLIATFVVISRPKPVQNLLAYLIGCLTLNTLVLLVPLAVLHVTPVFGSFVRDLASSTAAGGAAIQPMPVAMGVISLFIAAGMAVRLRLRVRQEASEPRVSQEAPLHTGGPATAVAVLEAEPSTDSERPSGRAGGLVAAALSRLVGRTRAAWESGSPWVSVLMGMAYSPVQVTIALTIIATSGAGIGAQLGAAIAFVVVILAIVEIILISCVVAPEKTQNALRPLHGWVQARRDQVLAAVFAVVGLSLVATGTGIF